MAVMMALLGALLLMLYSPLVENPFTEVVNVFTENLAHLIDSWRLKIESDSPVLVLNGPYKR
jgi:hypothetical protein